MDSINIDLFIIISRFFSKYHYNFHKSQTYYHDSINVHIKYN